MLAIAGVCRPGEETNDAGAVRRALEGEWVGSAAMATLELGLRNRRRFTVTPDLSPPHLAPIVVLSTPDMIRLMEETCTAAVQPFIEGEDQTTVGTHVNVSHEAAATACQDVEVGCELIEVDRRRLTFLVEARVGDRIIGQGTHQRHVVDRSRFAS
ncbi:MAG: thioesterase [Acidimicrobiia bacterium]|nr:thioesterase [Acidimicrobiia bacterium]